MTMNETLNKLCLIFKIYAPGSKPNDESQMCLLWSTRNPPDVLEGTKQLEEIEEEFEISLTEDEAIEMYDMNLHEAALYIQHLLKHQ